MTPEEFKASREQILAAVENANDIAQNLRIKDGVFFSEIPTEAVRKFMLVEREINRLRQNYLTIAFVGGFSAGKSSLVNAFLGRYLLPESTEVTTAVPTFIRSTSDKEFARLSYLSKAEVDGLEDLYRQTFADKFKIPELRNMPVRELLDKVRPMTTEGKGKKLLEYFESFLAEKRQRDISERGLQRDISLKEIEVFIRDEKEAMFLDRIEIFVKADGIPEDVQIVDLPGISVPNPRHERLTYRFVTQDAHALVFVLRSTQLFNQDELDILEQIRSGDSAISEKTFWVLNRWDALSEIQRTETLTSFQARMREYGISEDYVMVKTNALHGLLAQLRMKGLEPEDPKLRMHLSEYERKLPILYGDDHRKAFQDSEIGELQREVLDYLNHRIRYISLKSAANNTTQNLIQPLLHHLAHKKMADELLIQGELNSAQQAEIRSRSEAKFIQRRTELARCFKKLRDDVAVSRGEQFSDDENKIAAKLREQIESGSTTNAYEVYKSIIADNKLRTFPYYFEIEMRVVDGLNSLLKQEFQKLVREHVNDALEQLTTLVRDQLEILKSDVNFDTVVDSSLARILNGSREKVLSKVDGIVEQKAGQLDSLLVYKPKNFFAFFGGGNEIIDGLENAARMFATELKDVRQQIKPEHMEEKTQKIRSTLRTHYIKHVEVFGEDVRNSVWPIVIKEMHELEAQLAEELSRNYRILLERSIAGEVEGQFHARRDELQARSTRFRQSIESLQEANSTMQKALMRS